MEQLELILSNETLNGLDMINLKKYFLNNVFEDETSLNHKLIKKIIENLEKEKKMKTTISKNKYGNNLIPNKEKNNTDVPKGYIIKKK